VPVNYNQVAALFIVASATRAKLPPGQYRPDDDKLYLSIYLSVLAFLEHRGDPADTPVMRDLIRVEHFHQEIMYQVGGFCWYKGDMFRRELVQTRCFARVKASNYIKYFFPGWLGAEGTFVTQCLYCPGGNFALVADATMKSAAT